MYKSVAQKEINLAEEYFARCEEKLQSLSTLLATNFVTIRNPAHLSEIERQEIIKQISKQNFALYQCCNMDKESLQNLGLQLGLQNLDHNHCADKESISSLTVTAAGSQKYYIPYSNKPLSWHTDGYYNPLDQSIRAFILHCVRPAEVGGENTILDPDLVYHALWQENPDYVFALSHAHAMTIPENVEAGKLIRPSQTGPVFSFHKGHLHMRYTARKRNIEWKTDSLTQSAVKRLESILSHHPYAYKLRLQANQGVISNNVLHNRKGFEDGTQKRLYYRARYYDRIQGS